MNIARSMFYPFVMSLGMFMRWNYVVVAMFECE